MDLALYHPDLGFYATSGQAGRRGDFVTSVEVGPLFGQVMADYLDRLWTELGRPAPFTIVDAGAGPGTLARTIRAAGPACAEALDYVAVERSAHQRSQHPDGIRSLPDLPTAPIVGAIVANELLDNLAFEIVHWDIEVGFRQVAVMVDSAGEFAEVLTPTEFNDPAFDPGEARSARLVWQPAATRWLQTALDLVERGRVLVLDYTNRSVYADHRAASPIRTYRDHRSGSGPLDRPGEQDITADVQVRDLIAVEPPALIATQADWLRANGIDDLVAEGKRVWADRAGIGDLAALKARSRIGEAEALLDPDGLGAFTVLEWRR